MAVAAFRLRRALTTLSSLHHHHNHHFSRSTLPSIPSFPISTPTASPPPPQTPPPALFLQSRLFRSSSISLSPSRPTNKFNEHDTIDPDTILFEGCDYNHWLITMDFPKDPAPTREEMIATYEKTCAQGLNISIEEAKKKIYACSTTTYQGFQALMTEEESEKFNGIPGVVFILPDSYIDPQNKEYGGDKYVNGEIFPRPPPFQARQRGRFRDGNRNFDQPRYDRQDGPMPNRQGNTPYGQSGSVQGDGRNYAVPPNYPPQQNYGQPASMQGDGRNYGAPPNNPPQQNYGQPGSMQGDGRNYGAPLNNPPQQNYGQPGSMQGDGRNYGAPPNNQPQQNYGQRGSMQGDGRNYGAAPNNPPQLNYGQPGSMQGDGRNYGAPPNYSPQQNSGPPGQRERRDFIPPNNRDFPQGDRRDYAPLGQGGLTGDNRNFAPTHEQGDFRGDSRNFAPTYGQGQGDLKGEGRSFAPPQGGTTEQGAGGRYGHGTGGAYGPGTNSGFGQSFLGDGEGQRFSQVEQRNVQEGQRNYPPLGQTGTEQIVTWF